MDSSTMQTDDGDLIFPRTLNRVFQRLLTPRPATRDVSVV